MINKNKKLLIIQKIFHLNKFKNIELNILILKLLIYKYKIKIKISKNSIIKIIFIEMK